MQNDERRGMAYHEAGHAVVALEVGCEVNCRLAPPETNDMDVKRAVSHAKKWVLDALADESVSNLGLE